MSTHTQSYVHATPPKAQVASTHWKHVSYLLTPPVGIMGATSSCAPVKLQQSANLPADEKALLMHWHLHSPGAGCPSTVSPSAGCRLFTASGREDAPSSPGWRSWCQWDNFWKYQPRLDCHSVLTPKYLPPQSQILMLLLHFFSSELLLCLESPLVIWFHMVGGWFMQTLSF